MVSYALENNAYGILANDSDFIMMNAPRYLSLHHLRYSLTEQSYLPNLAALRSCSFQLPPLISHKGCPPQTMKNLLKWKTKSMVSSFY